MLHTDGWSVAAEGVGGEHLELQGFGGGAGGGCWMGGGERGLIKVQRCWWEGRGWALGLGIGVCLKQSSLQVI